MHEIMISHSRLKVERRTGTEGPEHDPYAYEEYHVRTPQADIVLHRGLGVWLKLNGKSVEAPKEFDWVTRDQWFIDQEFPRLAGYRVEELERLALKLKSRCSKCGSRKFHTETGFPGEYFNVCNRCKNIQSGYFCESEVI